MTACGVRGVRCSTFCHVTPPTNTNNCRAHGADVCICRTTNAGICATRMAAMPYSAPEYSRDRIAAKLSAPELEPQLGELRFCARRLRDRHRATPTGHARWSIPQNCDGHARHRRSEWRCHCELDRAATGTKRGAHCGFDSGIGASHHARYQHVASGVVALACGNAPAARRRSVC